MKENKKLSIKVSSNGCIVMKNAQTIKRYQELHEEIYHHEHEGIFYAFSEEQYNKGYEKIKHLLKEGEEPVRIPGGGFGSRECVKKMMDYIDQMYKKIADECNPQEVYCYEYNNHECMLGYCGDLEAMDSVYGIWGEDGLRAVKKRVRPYLTVEQVILTFAEPIELEQELTMNGEKPHLVWFDHEGLAFCMSACTLYPVMQGDVQFRTTNETWYDMSAHYDISKTTGKPILYRFYKD